MYDWIAANWIWLLLGVGVFSLLFRRGGMGCGMGGHGSHDHSGRGRREFESSEGEPHAGHDPGSTPPPRDAVPAGTRGRRGGGC